MKSCWNLFLNQSFEEIRKNLQVESSLGLVVEMKIPAENHLAQNLDGRRRIPNDVVQSPRKNLEFRSLRVPELGDLLGNMWGFSIKKPLCKRTTCQPAKIFSPTKTLSGCNRFYNIVSDRGLQQFKFSKDLF